MSDTNVHIETTQRDVGEDGEGIDGYAYGDETHTDGTPKNRWTYRAYRSIVNNEWGRWQVSFGTESGPVDEEFQEALRKRLKEKFPDSNL